MTEEIQLLSITAASIALFHTLFGPDHYLPFIVMSRAGKWSISKTMWITLASGIGHVLSSILLGFIGIAMGLGVNKLTGMEAGRGSLAAWLLIAFGFAYFVWGMRKAYRNKKHSHIHVHEDGTYHDHKHSHYEGHAHVHTEEKEGKKNLTPWILFTIFVLGPCEPLIPIVMYPAAEHNYWGLFIVTVIFAVITIVTMLLAVLIGYYGVSFIRLGKLERYSHALAGATILISGLAIIVLGL